QKYVDRAVSWVLGNSDLFLNTVGDIHLLPKVLDAASRYEGRPADDEMKNMVKEREMEALWPE
ncbi:aldo/keto reductase, partial [Candidatus Bipolaricaulota bacterium]|nr:aldo/keto reductase [Candidatus Bipolaricaulota bacterium]